jgi:ATP-dependent Lon protease
MNFPDDPFDSDLYDDFDDFDDDDDDYDYLDDDDFEDDLPDFLAELEGEIYGASEFASQHESVANLPILPLRGLVVFPHTAMPLTVGQARSLKLVEDVSTSDRLVGLFSALDPDMETPGSNDIYMVGTLAQIHRLFRAPNGTVRLLVQGISRIRVSKFTATEPFLRADVETDDEDYPATLETEALLRNVSDQFTKLAELMPNIPSELVTSSLNLADPLQTIYSIATYMRIEVEDQQTILELSSLQEKLHKLMRLLGKELEVLELGRKIQTDAQGEMERVQREYFLREQLKAIQKELGEADDQTADIEAFRAKIEAAGLSEEAEREARRELERLSKLPTAVAEYGVIRTYLDWLVELPWNKRTEDNLDIKHARQVLQQDHYGLEDIKERIVEFLAVRKLRQLRREQLAAAETKDQLRQVREGVILCFVGPPGVGKTSLGASIARALGRKFIRMSLGGVRDEAEIRGFRRTYVGAMPGRIIQSLRRAETRNPIIMLDEVDKLGRDFRGDPSAALLEVLDPEQNVEFRDHYLDVAFDLSQVMFITTANELDPIPAPLRDRMEIIQLSGYTELEKVEIAKQYLVPRQIHENGLLRREIDFDGAAILKLIQEYTREAGVRNLEREIGKVIRKLAIQLVEGERKKFKVNAEKVRAVLGHPKAGYRNEAEERLDRPGVAIGLAWTPLGGDILFVEAAQMAGSKGFQYTGQLGEVMQESARAAFSYVRSHHRDFKIADDHFEKHDIHLHVPAGAIPKDGPSAGVTMTTALVSLLTGRLVKNKLAMTGEVTLRGQVLPVGGIKDKILAADRFNLTTVILPKRNEPDLDELPDEVRKKMTFILVESIDEVLEAALLPAPKPKAKPTRQI